MSYIKLELDNTEFQIEHDNEYAYLCNECKEFGFCTAYYYLDENTNQLKPINNSSSNDQPLPLKNPKSLLDKKELIELVNLHTEISEVNTGLGRKIQTAHDLFHQDEFEQASYLYQEIIQTRSDIQEAWRGLLACFYFLGKYDEAISVSMSNSLALNSSFIDKLINTCEYLQNVGINKNEHTALPESNYNLHLHNISHSTEKTIF